MHQPTLNHALDRIEPQHTCGDLADGCQRLDDRSGKRSPYVLSGAAPAALLEFGQGNADLRIFRAENAVLHFNDSL